MMEKRVYSQCTKMGSVKSPTKQERLYFAVVEKELELPCEYNTQTGIQKVTTYGLCLKGYADHGNFFEPMYIYDFDHLHVDKDLVVILVGALTKNQFKSLTEIYTMINAFREAHHAKVYERARLLFAQKTTAYRGEDRTNARQQGEIFLHFSAGNIHNNYRGGRAK